MRIQDYQSARWSDLIDLWRASNAHLLHAAGCMIEEGRGEVGVVVGPRRRSSRRPVPLLSLHPARVGITLP